MKLQLSIFLFSISVIMNAMDFAPIGTKWYYSQAGIIDLNTYKTIESVADTIIEGKTCRKLTEISRNKFAPERSSRYMYSKNDSVFEYYNSTFHLLYNFRAQKGDSIQIDAYPRKLFVDSTATIDINGHILKVQYVTCTDGLSFDFGGKVIENIGNLNFMFPTHDFNYDGPLRCYSDPIIGSYINPVWNSTDCEKIETGIDKNYDSVVLIYYNKASSSFITTGLNIPYRYELFDVQGKRMDYGKSNNSGSIHLNDLAKGIFFIKINNHQTVIIRKIINY
jgi:hypothetical protein